MRSHLLIRLHAAALCASIALPSVASAANGESSPLKLGDGDPTAPASGGGGAGTLVRTIVGLAVVIAVIYGLTWILRQVKSSRETGALGNGLQSIATLPLGNDRSLHLVRAGDEVVLVGAGSGGVTAVKTYTLDEARRQGLLGDEEDDTGLGGGGRPGPGSGLGPRGPKGRAALEALRSRTVLK